MTLLIAIAAWSLGGWGLLLAGFMQRRRRFDRLERQRTRATATVDDYVRKGRSAFPVLRFTADGHAQRAQAQCPLDPEAYPVGAQVEVLYDADDPASFHLESEAENVRAGKPLIRIGILWIAVAAALAWATLNLTGYRPGPGSTDPARLLRRLSQSVGQRQTPEPKAYDYTYTLDSLGMATLTRYSGSASEVTVPVLLDGHVVTGVASGAYSGHRELTAVTVPGSVQTVRMWTFAGCISLRSVTLREGVRVLDKQAFGMCAALQDVALPASLERIADDAFPEDCAATFHVIKGSVAEQYCRDRGYIVIAEDKK